MLAFSSFIGVLLILGVLAGYVLKNRFTTGPLVVFKDNKKVAILLSAAVFLAFSNSLFFYSRFGHQYYLVYPTGGWSTIFSSGIKFRWFATIQEWQKEIDIKVVGEGESAEGIEGVILDKVTFQINGQKVSVPG